MTLNYVLLQNLRRNPLRTLLTGVAFALPMGIFVAAISFVVALAEIDRANQQELRLGVHHKTTLINLNPEALRVKIEAMDPDRAKLVAVCGMRWFGGRIPNTQGVVQSLAADPDTFPIVYAEVAMTPDDIEAWNRDRQACVIGRNLAENNRWNVGDRLTLVSSVPPYLSLEFHVVKVMDVESRTNVLYFRRDFMAESLKAAGVERYADCNIFWVKCQTADALGEMQRRIDAEFANTPNETKSEDEVTFARSFAQALGDIPGLMRVMAAVVVAIVALVAGNSMMMTFRERTRELAVFKAIGFSSGRVVFLVLGESVLLALCGALAGVVPSVLFLTTFPIRRVIPNFLPIAQFTVSPLAVGISLAIALLVGVVAGLAPAYHTFRMQTVNALRRVGE